MTYSSFDGSPDRTQKAQPWLVGAGVVQLLLTVLAAVIFVGSTPKIFFCSRGVAACRYADRLWWPTMSLMLANLLGSILMFVAAAGSSRVWLRWIAGVLCTGGMVGLIVVGLRYVTALAAG